MDQRLLRILESAIRAPSADNRLPIRFRVSQKHIDIIASDDSFAPRRGYRQVLALLSLGAVIESMAIAARENRLEPTVQVFERTGQGDPLTRVNLREYEQGSDPLAPFIALRHTNRRPFYRGPRMTDSERRSLEKSAESFDHGVSVEWLNDPQRRREAVSLIGKAESERFRNKALHEELFSAIRFDQGWKSTTDEGLPPGALAVETMLRPLFSTFRYWPVMRIAKVAGMHRLLGFRSAGLPCRTAPDLAVLTTREVTPPAILASGRAFMRIWLTITSLDRALQPLPASALYALEDAFDRNIPDSLHVELANGWRRLVGPAIPVMLFRIGKARPAEIHAGRPSVSSFVATT